MNGEEGVVSASISSANSVREVHDIVRSAACIPSTPKVVLKLYSEAGILLPIGPHLQKNNISAPYKLVKHTAKSPGACEIHGSLQNILQSVNEAKAMVEDVDDMKKSVVAVKTKVEQIEKYSDLYAKDRPLQKPATRRVSRVFQAMPLPVNFPAVTLTNDVLEQMKKPTFDIWLFQETELIHLIAHMFTEFGLIETFQIDKERLYMFLTVIKSTYNRNPFHNFQHCFCVTQMMYALLHVTSVHQKFTQLEKLALIVAAIGHDLDHPGFNNAYQVNASTELATTYNDSSPLENHHAAVLFSILLRPESNILSGLSAADYKDIRKTIIMCILATDMAKHGEVLSKFKSYADNFSYDDVNHRHALFQMLIKCSDISNEVRPKHVSEPWVDNLLDEFFTQSDKEKLEGLPTAPFMDRDKVTKPSAQVGFIGFVMIPLFELVSKVLPDMEESIIQPIKNALEFYRSSLKPSS
ncbi:hypothetical protein BASA50_003018 [Batrachochytrium salamandrivorans]|uniref:Phosphodiesterase n=1 Tax=Batrachochytrium salamandrivorans TaxID=1357716 RepID=A0ABQ8FJS9_9FUNG|nr:hypothetical protein BASA62_008999 [Batrachochytrium salamandrivorans]KAH6599507.1 hypothetical protein BASA50_003018 [Batrachochytrium salamandrivorans]KAH9277008.1 hypothetical protein BASA83_000525 [Batrachochytrium salamandrivorans]KAJ1344277.1 hypothetical protein BSLG_001417 [Batrachochytrium salamandrivorans]